MPYLLLFLSGLMIGSFWNVVAFRFKEGQFLFGRRVIGGRSHCMHCKKTLAWYELIPLASFIIQRGVCRKCRSPLSFQYPLIEFLAGAVALLTPHYFLSDEKFRHAGLLEGNPSLLYGIAALWTAVFLFLLLLALIDFREYLVPDEIVYFLVAAAVLWIAALGAGFGENLSFLGGYSELFGFPGNIYLGRLVGGIAGASVIGLIFFLSKGRAIGFGDVKLLGALGLLFGWPDILLILFLSFIIGAAVGAALLLRKAKGLKDFVPFAPFISLSAFITFYWGVLLMDFYFDLFAPL